MDWVSDETMLFRPAVEENAAEKTIRRACEAMEEKGYNPINQLVGYLLSGDPLDNVRQLTVKEEFSDNDLQEPKPYYIWQLVDNDGKAIKHLHIEGSNSILDWFGR